MKKHYVNVKHIYEKTDRQIGGSNNTWCESLILLIFDIF